MMSPACTVRYDTVTVLYHSRAAPASGQSVGANQLVRTRESASRLSSDLKYAGTVAAASASD
eukprot:44859-Hanusia_phi.AAC.1